MSDAATVPLNTGPALFTFDNTFVRDLEGLYRRWQATPVAEPELLVLNESLAAQLGADPEALASPDGVAVLAGNVVPDGAEPVAQAYSGHQFGGFSPVLGDGRALLLGEVIDPDGNRWDLQLKGSGRTPFARGGDGKAAVGPMLREHLLGEAMAALGIPTTRMLAVVATGETVHREGPLPGAVLARVAASHLRIGTFQFAATQGGPELVRRLADYAIARHHPTAADADNPYVALLEQVAETQAALVARWMLVGFIHGVMNTDNVTISGETIDYGPCAFMDAFDPSTVFSSIDHGGRYAYGNQGQITQWNLARLAETLLDLLAPEPAPDPSDPAVTDTDATSGSPTGADAPNDAAVAVAMEVLNSFPDRFARHWRAGLTAKLGCRVGPDAGDPGVLDELPGVLAAGGVDFTSFFRSLADAVRSGDDAPVRALFAESDRFDRWAPRWRAQLPLDRVSTDDVAAAMDAVNPRYIPRNHLVEAALEAATAGDLGPYHQLLDVVTHPFEQRAGLDEFAGPAPADFGPYQTYCGT